MAGPAWTCEFLIMSSQSSLCGPDELVDAILDYRQRLKQHPLFDLLFHPPILFLDEQRIRAMVRLAYHASLLPDEGRYLKFRIVYSPCTFGHGIGLGDLGQRIDSPDALRRLAPAVGGRETALLVGPQLDGDLAPWRIVDFEQICGPPVISTNRLADTPILPNGLLFLRVDGPGDLRAMFHRSPIFQLRGGSIRTLDSFYDRVEPFRALVLNLCTALHNDVKADKRIEIFVPKPEILTEDFADLWAATLSTAIEGRHGGAFAVVPSYDCPHLRLKYKAEGGLFTAFQTTLRHCLDSTDPSDLGLFKQYWQAHQNHLRRAARLIGDLAATDGCVVLDSRLDVKGFGAKIDWRPEATFLPMIDKRSGDRLADEQIEKNMGTRHRSACRLAQILPGAIIFVISQDGDLTAVFSNESCAFRITQLEASSSVSEWL